jgi:hypothetical protein
MSHPCGWARLAFSAYSPQTNVMYVELQNLCANYRVRVDNIPSQPKDQYNTIGPQVLAPGSTNIGRLDAISVETRPYACGAGKRRGPIIRRFWPTAGGILFNGSMDPLSAGLRSKRRQAFVADAAGIAGVCATGDLPDCRAAIISRWRPAAASTMGRYRFVPTWTNPAAATWCTCSPLPQ